MNTHHLPADYTDFDIVVAAIRTFGKGAHFTKEELFGAFQRIRFEAKFKGFRNLNLIRENPNQPGEYFLAGGDWEDLVDRKTAQKQIKPSPSTSKR